MNYRIGLDIGIGSIGWAVIAGDQKESYIEDFGVRIFDSGESNNGKDRKSQERRGFRGTRRLVRRRYFRKILLKNHLINIGLINDYFNDNYEKIKNEDVYSLKVTGLDNKLSPEELYKCLIHTCNHRGYKDFYEDDDTDDDKEAGINKQAVRKFDELFEKSNCRTVSEYLIKEYKNGNFVEYRNIDSRKENYMLVHRYLLKEEVEKILNKQKEYYKCLTSGNIETIINIIFSQRCFEDGPGNPNDSFRRYKGFLESLGTCPFYKDLKRGFRSTVISDVFAVTNTLSQYRFVCKDTGEYNLTPEIAKELIEFTLKNANITMTNVKNILKSHGYQLLKSENSDDKALSKAIKYLKIAKKSCEEADMDWDSLINEEQFEIEAFSKLHQIGEVISKYQTPSRRKDELKKLGYLDEKGIKAFSNKKISGTSAASYKFMCESIKAFMNGEVYGNFQENFKKDLVEIACERKFKLKVSDIDDTEIKDNSVVFRSINETRKLVNAIIDVYGSPKNIIIEVASDLNRCADERAIIQKQQKANERANEKVKEEIAKILNIDIQEVKGVMLDKYKLYQLQQGKSAYSGMSLGDDIKEILLDTDHKYEVDHIVPYSLILDNTLNNKVLVTSTENQLKAQRTPLMYLKGEERDSYIARVNEMYSRKENPISKRKYQYLMLENIYNEDLLRDWKSRNINDTRYITKYILSLFKNKLLFSSNSEQPVYAVKGKYTSKFRKIWLKDSIWGSEEKCRDNYLNHALDAVVIANLTPAYIEIASDNLKLTSIYKKHHKQTSKEYNEYLEKCLDKQEKYYHFSREYTRSLLINPNRVPSYLPNLAAEVAVRFNDTLSKAEFDEKIEKTYKEKLDNFIVKPHIPLVSLKQEKKFRGGIADSNPIKIANINGEVYKIKRIKIADLTKKNFDKIYSNDKKLIKKLEKVFENKDEKYTVSEYLEEIGETKFKVDSRTIFKISLVEGKFSNYYKKQIDDENYSYLGMLKYYCIEIYEDQNGNTKTYGIRYVDIVRKNKKLYLKDSALPSDYCKHIMYLFKNDYIRVYNKKDNSLKFEGFYQSVKNINTSYYYFKINNLSNAEIKTISSRDIVKKFDVSILGRIGGEIKCSEPLSLISEKK